jgi:1,4-dihydroxy-2-naphthoyl-CoA hydrolase
MPEFSPEYFNAMGRHHLPEHLGIVVVRVERGELEAELPVTPQLLAPNGYLHAASVVALADTTAGYGCLAHLPEGAKGFTTIELKSNHLGTVREGIVSCVARPAHLGRTTQVWDVQVSNPATGRAIALFRCTQMILY